MCSQAYDKSDKSQSGMETSALNLAHEKQRRAEALLREGKFEEAAKCHETVANLLAKAYAQAEGNFINIHASAVPCEERPAFLTSLCNVHSFFGLESLSLQQEYHMRQAAIVRMKQAQYEEYKTTLESKHKDVSNKQAPKSGEKEDSTEIKSNKPDNTLRQAIHKTIDKQDSLLSLIPFSNNEDKSFKHLKDTGTIIQELRSINCQLRCLVGSLLSQLEAKEEEVQQLTERFYALSANSGDDIRSESHLRFPPLPPLTPLEMPLFDFTSS